MDVTLIISDLDGTLVDTKKANFLAYRQAGISWALRGLLQN